MAFSATYEPMLMRLIKLLITTDTKTARSGML